VDALGFHGGRPAVNTCPKDSAKKGGGAPDRPKRKSASYKGTSWSLHVEDLLDRGLELHKRDNPAAVQVHHGHAALQPIPAPGQRHAVGLRVMERNGCRRCLRSGGPTITARRLKWHRLDIVHAIPLPATAPGRVRALSREFGRRGACLAG